MTGLEMWWNGRQGERKRVVVVGGGGGDERKREKKRREGGGDEETSRLKKLRVEVNEKSKRGGGVR